jgi:hypothetical protein
MSMTRERRKEIKERLRFLAAALIENIEILQTDGFEDLTDDEHSFALLEQERIGKSIWRAP